MKHETVRIGKNALLPYVAQLRTCYPRAIEEELEETVEHKVRSCRENPIA